MTITFICPVCYEDVEENPKKRQVRCPKCDDVYLISLIKLPKNTGHDGWMRCKEER
jgi:hypothetical protein